MFKSTGQLIYSPKNYERKQKYPTKAQHAAEDWIILKTDDEINRYYQWYLKRHYDLKFENTIWGSHISVTRGHPPEDRSLWYKYQNHSIPFTYDNKIYLAGDIFLYVNCWSEELENIRKELGFSPTPPCGFHITIGRIRRDLWLSNQKALSQKLTHLSLEAHNDPESCACSKM